MGPRMEPRGTPQTLGAEGEESFLNSTENIATQYKIKV